MVELELIGVRVEMPSNSPIVLLRERAGRRRVLPIFIGTPEATAIALAVDGVVTPRPMTHDLFVEVMGELGATLVRVVITGVEDGVYFADLHLAHAGTTSVVSSRPSDAVALAARTGAPIFAEEELMEAAATDEVEDEDDDGDGPPAEEVVEEFRAFIDKVNPEDFAS